MYNVIIVEDEALIRTALKTMIQWEKVGFTLSEVFNNGKQAIQYLEHNYTNVNVIITDIKMPLMSGLELSHIVHQKYPKIKIIILSGYSDIEFAQSAIDARIYKYLLKPLKPEELYDTLKKIKLELQKDNNDEDLILKNLLTDATTSDEKNVLNSYLKGRTVCCSIFSIDNSKVYNSYILKNISNAFINYKAEHSDELIFIVNNLIITLTDYDTNYSRVKKMHKDILELLAHSEYEYCSVSCGVSLVSDNISEMYRQAYKALKRCFYSKDASFNVFDGEYRSSLELSEYKELRSLEEKLISNLIANKPVFEYIDKIESFFTDTKRIEPSVAINALRRIALNLNDYISSKKINYEEIIEIEKFTNLHNIVCYIKNIITIINETYSEDRESKLVKDVKQYVHDNYQKRITLQTIEENFYVNKSYFSWLFSKETGETFSSYLSSYRISIAKKLLKNNTLRIYEVAEFVGYNDYRSFCRTFKKIVGISPQSYKENL